MGQELRISNCFLAQAVGRKIITIIWIPSLYSNGLYSLHKQVHHSFLYIPSNKNFISFREF